MVFFLFIFFCVAFAFFSLSPRLYLLTSVHDWSVLFWQQQSRKKNLKYSEQSSLVSLYFIISLALFLLAFYLEQERQIDKQKNFRRKMGKYEIYFFFVAQHLGKAPKWGACTLLKFVASLFGLTLAWWIDLAFVINSLRSIKSNHY